MNTVNHFNQHGNTALHYACFWRYAEVALFLSKSAGAYIKIANHYNQLPIDHTSKKLHSVLVEISKDQGMDQVVRAQSLEDINEKEQSDLTASKFDVLLFLLFTPCKSINSPNINV